MNIEVIRRKIAADIEGLLLTGRLARTLTKDVRGPRYVVAGLTFDKRSGRVVCRMLPSGKLRIITVYLED